MEEVSNHEIRTHRYQYSSNLFRFFSKLLFRLILCCGLLQRCWLTVSMQGMNSLHLNLNSLSVNSLMVR